MPMPQLTTADAVVVVDLQNDFCTGGALPVADGGPLADVLNRWTTAAIAAGGIVVASRDWHPRQHCSFTEQGGPWPPHCVQETEGAAMHPALRLPPETILVSKGTDPHQDEYSALADTALAETLKQQGIRRLWIGGLAQDVCVKATALDAIKAGFEVFLIPEATAPVTVAGREVAIEEMRAAGVVV